MLLAQTPAFAKGQHNNPPRNPAPHNTARRNGPAAIPHVNAPNPPKVDQKRPQPEQQHAEVPKTENPKTNEQQHPRVGEWLTRSQNLSPTDQQKALNNDPEFKKLAPERQQQLRKQLEDFNKLSPEEKDRVIRNMQAFDRLPPDQQRHLREIQGKLRDVPDDRRKMMQTALRSLRQMEPAEREQVLNSDKFKGMFNDNEREIMRGLAEFSVSQPGQQQSPAPEQQKQQGPAIK